MTTATIRRPGNKYAAVFHLAARQTLERRGELFGRCALYALLLFVFSSLWKTVYSMGGLDGNPASYLWYLAVTEWIVISIPYTHQAIEDDVQSGDVAYSLSRPMSYLGLRVVEGLGQLAVRMAALAIVGFTLTFALTGGLPEDPRGLLAAVPLGILGGATVVCWYAAIGCTAFWIQDANALYWVVQKLLFVLGGLILPLSIYPDWLRRIAEWLPFAAVLYGPGRMVIDFNGATFADSLLKLLLWGTVSVLVMVWIYARARERLEVNGG